MSEPEVKLTRTLVYVYKPSPGDYNEALVDITSPKDMLRADIIAVNTEGLGFDELMAEEPVEEEKWELVETDANGVVTVREFRWDDSTEKVVSVGEPYIVPQSRIVEVTDVGNHIDDYKENNSSD